MIVQSSCAAYTAAPVLHKMSYRDATAPTMSNPVDAGDDVHIEKEKKESETHKL